MYRALALGLLAAVGGSALVACDARPTGEAPDAAGPPPVKVEAVTLDTRPFAERTWLPAEVRPREAVRLSAEALGRVTWVCCEENEAVEKGRLLARIDTSVNQAQVAAARTELAQARRELRRIEPLRESGAATPAQIDAARSRRDAARAAYDQAVAALKKTTVRSPIDGRIAVRHLQAGEIAQPGQPLFDLVDIEVVEVVAGLPERDFAALAPGRTVEVRIDAYPGDVFAGEVTRVGLVAGAARTFPVEVTVPNPGARLRPGMMGEVQVTKRTFEHVVVIPLDAIVDEFESRRVYVVGPDGRTAEEREVVLGPRDGAQVTVLDGLEPGDRLVVTGHRLLTDGRPIEVVRGGRLDAEGRPAFDGSAEVIGARPTAVGGRS